MLGISPKQVSDLEGIDKKLYSLRLLQTPRSGKLLAYWLLGIIALFFVIMFVPWQQNVTGTGKMTALTPEDRPQDITAIIGGQIRLWKVREGQFVKKNDTILVLSETKSEYLDPNQLLRIKEQLEAKDQGVGATRQNIQAIEIRIDALKSNLQFSLEKARNKVLQNRYKLISDSTDYLAEKLQFQIAKDQFERYKTLYDKGLISLTEFQRRQLSLQEKQAKMISSDNKFSASQQELYNSMIELNSLSADYTDKIFKAESEKNSYQAYLAKSNEEISEKKNKYANTEIRNNQYYILAPQNGYIIKALRAGIGETVKEGEAVVTIQPENPHKAVEIYLKAMDVPLVRKGVKVRLEFDGWPALQFSGWPSVSVGTFGGEISVVDYVSGKDGKFRALIVPDIKDEPWPAQLRLGSGVNGWVMLEDVPVWWEIWRQFNGFPPSLSQEPENDDKKKK